MGNSDVMRNSDVWPEILINSERMPGIEGQKETEGKGEQHSCFLFTQSPALMFVASRPIPKPPHLVKMCRGHVSVM